MSKPSFASIRGKSNALEDFKKKFESTKGNRFNNQLEDETYWTMKHLRNEDGKGTATIRLLPPPPNEDDPFVFWHEYQFKGKTGKWYINRSPLVLGEGHRDPAYEYNGKIFAQNLPKEEQQKRLLGRNTNYVFGILVIKDPNKPENEGKVFRWKVGPQLYKIVESALFPEFGGDPVPVFDPIDGANLEIRVYTKKIPNRNGSGLVEVPSYEKSGFLEPSALCDLEDFDEIWNRQYSLKEVIAEEHFKSYEQLLKEFNAAMGDSDEDEAELSPVKEQREAKTKAQKVVQEQPVVDDEIPWDTADPVEEQSEDSSSSDDSIDDWLNSLK